MTPSLKFMNTGQLVNAFEKGSWQRAQERTRRLFTPGTWRTVVFAKETEQD